VAVVGNVYFEFGLGFEGAVTFPHNVYEVADMLEDVGGVYEVYRIGVDGPGLFEVELHVGGKGGGLVNVDE